MTHSVNDEDGCKSGKWGAIPRFLRFLPKHKLNKTEASYFALFRTLPDIQSRLILLAGVFLAIAAGAPLPIIGVIFARIIDGFPPTEKDVNQRIVELIAVGEFIAHSN